MLKLGSKFGCYFLTSTILTWLLFIEEEIQWPPVSVEDGVQEVRNVFQGGRGKDAAVIEDHHHQIVSLMCPNSDSSFGLTMNGVTRGCSRTGDGTRWQGGESGSRLLHCTP